MIIHYVRKLACNKQLSELILRSVSGGVTPSTIPYLTDEFLAKVHQTPLSIVRAYLVECVMPPWREPLEIPLDVDRKRHDTYMLLIVLFIHEELILDLT